METFDTACISNETKEACAIETMRYMLEGYAEDHSVSFEEAFFRFTNSSTYKVLFDFSTQVWKEGPEYLRSLFEKALG